jgi:hypothetical protein
MKSVYFYYFLFFFSIFSKEKWNKKREKLFLPGFLQSKKRSRGKKTTLQESEQIFSLEKEKIKNNFSFNKKSRVCEQT